DFPDGRPWPHAGRMNEYALEALARERLEAARQEARWRARVPPAPPRAPLRRRLGRWLVAAGERLLQERVEPATP
ncbi:MAG TPA: hypothetical protein VFX28_16640, partial [Methylomirabilota bacterium]|nr:hypothetical protein [Methylomirabilota bacterium]